MTRIYKLMPVLLFLLLCLTACAPQTVKSSQTDDCVPDVQLIPQYIKLDAELLMDYRCSPVPPDGSTNDNLTAWAEGCANAAKAAADNIARIREQQTRD